MRIPFSFHFQLVFFKLKHFVSTLGLDRDKFRLWSSANCLGFGAVLEINSNLVSIWYVKVSNFMRKIILNLNLEIFLWNYQKLDSR